MKINDKLTISIGETAELMGLSRVTVNKLIERPDFPSFKIGKRILISRAGLEAWIAAQVEEQHGPTL